MSKSRAVRFALIVGTMFLGPSAQAATVSYLASGVITSSSADPNANYSATPVGTAFSILLIFDPATPDTNPPPTHGQYLNVGSYALTISGGPSITLPIVLINVIPTVSWSTSAYSSDYLTGSTFDLQGISPDDQIIPNLVPTSMNFLISDCNGYCGDFSWNLYEARGTITSFERVSDVPLPAVLPLFAAGLSAMGFMGWRKRRKAVVAG